MRRIVHKYFLVFTALIILTLSMMGQANSQQYTIIDIGIPEGDYTGTSLRGINEWGQVVGKVYSFDHPEPNDDHEIAFVWDTENSFQLLETLGGRWNEAWDINDSGQIVGEAWDSSGRSHAVIWEDGNVLDLGGVTHGRANAINNVGQVVGWFGSLASGSPFIWDSINGMQFPFGPYYTYPWAINDLGQVTGAAHDLSGSGQAFVWDDTNGRQLLGIGKAWDISNSGQIVGESWPESGTPPYPALWNGINSMVKLGGEYQQGSAYGVNDLGQIVGWVGLSGETYTHGAIWDEVNEMQDLNDLVYPYEGLEVITWAADINNSGQIAANARINGRLHAILLIPVSDDTDGDGIPDYEDDCPDSDLSSTVVIDDCDSGVPNTLFENGCTISDEIAELANNSTNHGNFTSAVAHYTNDLMNDGIITGQQKGAIQRCAGQADSI